jgi:hypothetical protein
MATVDLNSLLSYDLRINFEPLGHAIRGKADVATVDALSAVVAAQGAQMEMLKKLLGGGSSSSSEGGAGGGGGINLELLNQISQLTGELASLRDERGKDGARIEALEKALAAGGLIPSPLQGLLPSPSPSSPLAAAPSTSGDIDRLNERVGRLEDELSHILAQVSSELAKAHPDTVRARMSREDGGTAPAATTTATGAASPAAAGAASPAAGPAAAATAGTPEAVAAAAAAAAARPAAAAPAAAAASSSGAAAPADSSSSPSSSTSAATASATSSSGAAAQPGSEAASVEKQVLSRPRTANRPQTPVSGRASEGTSAGGAAASPFAGAAAAAAGATGLNISDYGAEIRLLGDRLQGLVSQIVPTAEIAAEARILAESANKVSRENEARLNHHEARIAALESKAGVTAPPAPAGAAVAVPVHVAGEDFGPAIAALRADLAALRTSIGAAPAPAPAAAAPAPAAPLPSDPDAALGVLRGEIAALARKEGDDASSLTAAVDALRSDLAARVAALQAQISAANDSLAKLGHPPAVPAPAPAAAHAPAPSPAPSPAAAAPPGLDALMQSVQTLERGLGGAQGDIARHGADLSELRASVESLTKQVDAALLAANGAAKGDGDAAALHTWAQAVSVALTVVTGGADDSTSAAARVASAAGGASGAGALSAFAAVVAELSANARPSATRTEVRQVGGLVAALDTRVTALEAKPDVVLPEIPAPADLTPLTAAVAGLEGGKADKADVDSRVEALQDALAAVSKKVGDYMKQLKGALGARPPTAAGGLTGDRAALTSKQLLKDFKCLSCDQPLHGLQTDRGDSVPSNFLTPHVPINKGYVFAVTGGATMNAAGGRPGSPERGGTGAFALLPNGHVISRSGAGGGRPASRAAGSPGGGFGGSVGAPEGTVDAFGNPVGSPGGARGGAGAGGGPVRLPPLGTEEAAGAAAATGDAPAGSPTATARPPHSMFVNRRGSGVAIAGTGGAAVAVAPTLVDSRSGSPLPHVFYAPEPAPVHTAATGEA